MIYLGTLLGFLFGLLGGLYLGYRLARYLFDLGIEELTKELERRGSITIGQTELVPVKKRKED
jgi:hypothetical protein